MVPEEFAPGGCRNGRMESHGTDLKVRLPYGDKVRKAWTHGIHWRESDMIGQKMGRIGRIGSRLGRVSNVSKIKLVSLVT